MLERDVAEMFIRSRDVLRRMYFYMQTDDIKNLDQPLKQIDKLVKGFEQQIDNLKIARELYIKHFDEIKTVPIVVLDKEGFVQEYYRNPVFFMMNRGLNPEAYKRLIKRWADTSIPLSDAVQIQAVSTIVKRVSDFPTSILIDGKLH